MRSYTIYIDENLPPQLAHGLKLLTQKHNEKLGLNIDVLSIIEVFGRGAKDEEWIPKVGAQNGIVITQDYNIQTTKHQKELYISSGLGILFLSSSKVGMSYWETVKLLVNKWEEIIAIVKKEKTPFAYRSSVKTKFEKI
jgi:hypothetical protein